MSDSVWIEGLLVKKEATYATDPTPTGAANGVRVSARIWPDLEDAYEWLNERDNVVSGTLLPVIPAKPQGRNATLTITAEPNPKGSAYAALGDLKGLTDLFQSAGLSATFLGTPDFAIDLTPVSALLDSATAYAYGGGNEYRVVGARSSCRISAAAGQRLVVGFTTRGMIRTDPTAVALPSITYNASEAAAFVGSSFSIGGWTGDVESFEIDFGQEVVLRPSGNASDGIAGIKIVRHRPRLRVTVEQAALATYNPYTTLKNRTSQAISTTLGVGAGLQFKIQSSTTGYLNNIRKAEVAGFTGYELEYLLTAVTVRFD